MVLVAIRLSNSLQMRSYVVSNLLEHGRGETLTSGFQIHTDLTHADVDSDIR